MKVKFEICYKTLEVNLTERKDFKINIYDDVQWWETYHCVFPLLPKRLNMFIAELMAEAGGYEDRELRYVLVRIEDASDVLLDSVGLEREKTFNFSKKVNFKAVNDYIHDHILLGFVKEANDGNNN